MVKYLNFHKSSLCLKKILFNENGKATVCDTPIVFNSLKGKIK
jgi:hypothetical protein